MKCPRTGVDMEEVTVGGVKVDISPGCGGVWFDNFELERFDEVVESAGEELIALIQKYKTDEEVPDRQIYSPRHPEMPMQRYFFSSKRQIEIDECPKCGGIWLDPGELTRIRELFPAEEDRKAAGKAFVEEVFAQSGFEDEADKNEAFRQKAQRIANILRWICPSYYIPGKQEGAAF